MNLINTLILAEDNQESRDKLTGLFQRNDILVLIIFGNDPSVNDIVGKADVIASQVIAGISRKVVWMQDLAMLSFLKKLITDGTAVKIDMIDPTIHVGLSISPDHILSFLIPKNPVPDNIRINLAFLNAGKSHK